MSDVWPEFLLRGETPYKVIKTGESGFLALNMRDGEVENVFPPGLKEFIDLEIWLGRRTSNSSFEATNNKAGQHFTFYFNEHFQLHREDGPAVIKKSKFLEEDIAMDKIYQNINKEFWIHGKHFDNAEEWFLKLKDKKKALFNLDEVE